MVVAVVAVLVMQAAVDDVVDVIAVRYGFMAATWQVSTGWQPSGLVSLTLRACSS